MQKPGPAVHGKALKSQCKMLMETGPGNNGKNKNREMCVVTMRTKSTLNHHKESHYAKDQKP